MVVVVVVGDGVVEMGGNKVGFWIWVFHRLQTQIQVRIDLIGRRRRIWVTMSAGKDSNIVACFQREIRVSESDF